MPEESTAKRPVVDWLDPIAAARSIAAWRLTKRVYCAAMSAGRALMTAFSATPSSD
jgi:hypothetical protein